MAQKNGNTRLATKYVAIKRVFKQLEKRKNETQSEIENMSKKIASVEETLNKHECMEIEVKNSIDILKNNISDKIQQLPIQEIHATVREAITSIEHSQCGSLSLPTSGEEPDSQGVPQATSPRKEPE